MDGSGAGTGRSGHDRPGRDGTQAPPPPPVFPDPLAGLVTGERLYQPPEATAPIGPPPVPRQEPAPPPAAPVRRPPQARRPAQAQRPAPRSAAAPRPAQASPPARTAWSAQASRPDQGLRQAPGRPPAPRGPGQQPTKSRSGLIGCLVGLAVLAGLLFNVLREIIEAVVDLLR